MEKRKCKLISSNSQRWIYPGSGFLQQPCPPASTPSILRVPRMLQGHLRQQDLGVCCSWLWRHAGGRALPGDKKKSCGFVLRNEGQEQGSSPRCRLSLIWLPASPRGDTATFTPGGCMKVGGMRVALGGGRQTGPAVTGGHMVTKSTQTDGRDLYVPCSRMSDTRCMRKETGPRRRSRLVRQVLHPAKAIRGWRWKLQHHQV